MKNAISRFINEHPILSYCLASAIVTKGFYMVTVLVRGYPTETTVRTISGETDENDTENEGEETEEE